MSGNLLWQRLNDEIRREVDAFPGVAGVALRDFEGKLEFTVNGDELFPTASTIKIHVLAQLLTRAEAGEIDLAQRVTLPSELTFGSGVLAYLEGPLDLSLLDVAILMIIASDNTATNICIDYAGIEDTNALLHSLGLTDTRLRRKMMDHIAAVREQENVSTPAELVQMWALLHQGKPSPWVAQKSLEILKKPKLGFLDRALPADIEFASKPGWVEAARCDTALVYLPRRPYALAVMTKYTLCADMEHEDFIGRIGKSVHTTMTMLAQSNRYGRVVYS
ncbi:MAG: serine hydrolase [Caldilineaceae bacterium]|nr:serine hydrolase [Caldilineaceae bacterium]